AAAEVELFRCVPEDQALFSEQQRSLVLPEPAARTTTDASGRFHLDVRHADRYVVRASALGWAGAESAVLELDPALGLEELDLPLQRGGAIEGRVLLPGSADAEGTIVVFNRGDGRAFSER